MKCLSYSKQSIVDELANKSESTYETHKSTVLTSDRTLLQPAAGAGHGRDRHRPGGQESGGELRGAVRGAVPRGEGAGRGTWPGHVTRDLDHDAGDGEGPQLEDTQQHEEAVRWPVLHS